MPRKAAPVTKDCTKCQGRGWVYNPETQRRDSKCNACGGTGNVTV